MARPRLTIRPTRMEISLPEDLAAEVRLFAVSPVAARLRSGALSEFFICAARRELAFRKSQFAGQTDPSCTLTTENLQDAS